MATTGYEYLPELQGLTDIQQQDLRQQFGQQRSQLQRGYGRSGLQSTGSYLGELAKLGAQEATGVSNIERYNQLKNAMLAREERMTKEQRAFQKEMGDINFNRQLQLMRMQQDQQNQGLIGGALGTVAGAFINPLIGAGLKGLGIGVSPMEKMFQGFDWSSIQPSAADVRGMLGMGGQ